jgi:hypothetical protein
MSTKEAAIQLIQQLSEDATLKDIVSALLEAQATQEALRRFDERGGIPDDDVTDEEWMAMICRSWADDLNDPRQDVYTLDEGTADDGSR